MNYGYYNDNNGYNSSEERYYMERRKEMEEKEAEAREALEGKLKKYPHLNAANAENILRIAKDRGISLEELAEEKAAKPEIEYKGPICDPIGFRQHEGECINDSFQQMILFTDGLKEITQPKMFDTTLPDKIEEKEHRELEAVKAAASENVSLTPSDLKKYIIYMQKRFREHYGKITGQADEKAKRRMSLVAAITCHRFFPESDESLSSRIEDYSAIKNALGLKKYRLQVDGKIDGPGYIMATNNYKPTDEKHTYKYGSQGHVISLYKCGGKYYLNDNEAGQIEISREMYKYPTKGVIVRSSSLDKNIIVIPETYPDAPIYVRGKKQINAYYKMVPKYIWDEGEWKKPKGEIDIGFVMTYSERIVVRGIKRSETKKLVLKKKVSGTKKVKK
jgi:hypothetical protein